MTKKERLADNRRRAALANKEFIRREKKRNSYLNSAKAKRLQKDVDDAIDAINVLVEEWNSIILERCNRCNGMKNDPMGGKCVSCVLND